MHSTSNKHPRSTSISRSSDGSSSDRQKSKLAAQQKQCDWCSRSELMSWFTTHGSDSDCSHIICARCMAKEHASRGCGVFLCRVCHKQGRGRNRRVHTTVFNEIEHDSSRVRVTRDHAVDIVSPHRDRDPVRFFYHETSQTVRHNTMMVSVVYLSTTTSNYNVIAMRLPTDQSVAPPEQEQIKLKEIFLLLHPYVMNPPASTPYRCFSHPADIPRPSAIAQPMELFAAARDDESLLFECILRLATGSSTLKTEAKTREGYWTSQLMAIWIAVEMIRRAASDKPGIFQQVLAEQLRLHQSSKNLMTLCSKMRLSASITYVDGKRFEMIDNKILAGWVFKHTAFGLFVVLYDNFGFRIRGASAGYHQSTMIQVKFVTPEELHRVKAYGRGKLSRKSLKWKEEKDNLDPDLFLPNDETNEVLSARSLQWIELALEFADMVPTVQEALGVIQDYTKSAKAAVPASVIPSEIVLPTDLENVSNRLTAGAVVETLVDEDEADPEDNIGFSGNSQERQTMYEINGVRIDVPWTHDLACSKTTDMVRDYTLHLRQRALAERENTEDDIDDTNGGGDNLPTLQGAVPDLNFGRHDNSDDSSSFGDSSTSSEDVPVMEDIGVFSVGDGSPAFQALVSRDKDPLSHTHYKNWNGPFHEFLEEFKKGGEKKDKIYARDLYGRWRKSDKAVDYVLYPSDPGQALPELVESNFAILVAAARATASKVDGATINPVKVLDHILERAREEPICMSVLMDMRLADLIFMVRDSENANGKGDPSLYRTALRYSAILYSTTNAYKYVRILSENFKDWYCASDLEKAIYDEFLFTQKTRNGRPIWTDRSVEWMMKDLRTWLGKHFQPGQELLLARLALNLSDMVKARTKTALGEGNSRAQHPREKKELGATRVFLGTIIWADEINLWGPGPIKYSKSGTTSTGYSQRAFDSTGEKEINLRHLLSYSIGQDNYRNYVKEFLFGENLNQVTRPSAKAPLLRIPALMETVNGQSAIDEAFYISRDFDQLNETGVYRKDDIVDQARKENTLLPAQDQMTLPTKSKAKKEHVKALLLIREKAAELNIDLEPAQTNGAESLPTAISWHEQIKLETERTYFKLSESQRQIFSTEEHEYTLVRGVSIGGVAPTNAPSLSQNTESSVGVSTIAGLTFVSSQ